MKNKTFLQMVTLAMMLMSCETNSCSGDSSSSSTDSSESNPAGYNGGECGGDEDVYQQNDDGEYEEEIQSQNSIRLTGAIETCNKCMGYGMVQDGPYGTPEICKFCWVSTMMRMERGWTGFDGTYGLVDAAFNHLPADYFDDLSWDTGNMNESSNGNQQAIEAEIERLAQSIAYKEQMLANTTSYTMEAQLRQEITEEQYEIRRLQMQLNY